MSALIIVDFTPKDPEQLAQYAAAAPATLAKFEGEVLAKGHAEALHGQSAFKTKVIIQFPDRAKALAWYESAEYQQLIPVRDQGMESQFQLLG